MAKELNDKTDMYEAFGCGCMIVAVGIAILLMGIAANMPEIIKFLNKS